MKEIKRKIKIPLYGGWIVIVITDECDVADAAKRHFNNPDCLKTYQAAVLKRENPTPRIYPVLFADGCEPGITPGLIAHESYHLLNEIYKDLGMSHQFNNDEFGAYLMSWIVNRIWEVKSKFEKL